MHPRLHDLWSSRHHAFRRTDTIEAVEHATLDWVDWFNNRRILEPIGYLPPAEFEEVYYHGQESPAMVAGLA